MDAVIWGLPPVGEDSVKQAAFRDGKANYNDIVWWPKGGGWRNQSPTPNVNTRYMYFFINTRQNGPVVVDQGTVKFFFTARIWIPKTR